MDNVEKIKDRLSIEDVVGSYIKLDKAGANLKACCPFHNEKTPSFFVSPHRGTYKCFGCGEGGDIFSFVEKFEGVDFKGALKILAEKAGVVLEKENIEMSNERKRLYALLEKTTVYFEKHLAENKEALAYLKKRGVCSETIKKFRLGMAQNDWQDLYDFLLQDGFTADEMEKAGLIKKREKGKGYYDRFRSRIIFPLFDNSDRPIAFSGRFFGENNSQYEQAKYLNSPETVLFHKSNILYGYNFAKAKIRKSGFSLLVEGQMDLVICHQAGYENTVASSGTALTQNHLELLKKLSKRVVLAFDGDKAGFLSANKATQLALQIGMEVRLMNIPQNSDPAELILQNKKQWKDLLKNAQHIVGFYLHRLSLEIQDKYKLGQAVKEKVLPFVTLVKGDIEKANLIKEIADCLEIPPEVVWSDLAKVPVLDWGSSPLKSSRIVQEKTSSQKKKNRKQVILREASGLYWWQKSLDEALIDLDKFEKDCKAIIGQDLFDKIKNLDEKVKENIIFEVEIVYDEVENLQEKIDELLKNLQIEMIDEEIKNVAQKQKQAEKEGQTEEVLKNLKKYNELSKQKNQLTP